MKIILFCEALNNRAGIERMTVELAGLLSEEHTVYIVTIEKFDEFFSPYKIPRCIKLISIDSKFGKSFQNGEIFNIGNIIRFRKLCKKLRPDVVITVATPLIRITAPAVFGLGVKNVGWEHFNLYAGSKTGTIFKLLSTWLVDRTVVLTKKDESDFKKFLSPRVDYIPNFTTIGDNETSKIKNKVLLAVGRHSYQKGFDLLLRAWSLAKPKGWILKIVGAGELKNDNINLSKELGIEDSVVFADSTPDIKSEFLNASCFVLSSRFEGLVLVLIEAKMMGLPSICFNCPNSPKEVIQNNIDGWLVEPESVTDMATEISLRLKDDLTELRLAGKEAHKDAMKKFSKSAVKLYWDRLLKDLHK